MTDLPALGAAHPSHLAVGIRGHVVVVHVTLLLVDAHRVQDLVHARHPQGGEVEDLGLSPLEQA